MNHSKWIPTIQEVKEKKLVGLSVTTSFLNDQTSNLWKKFMPSKNEILNKISDNFYSMGVYPPNFFRNFDPSNEFVRWAAAEVKEFDTLPIGFQKCIIPQGMYAVIDYKGLNTDNSIYEFIYSQWLPQSEFILDQRPHFEILGKNYKNGDPDSEELIFIPVKPKIT